MASVDDCNLSCQTASSEVSECVCACGGRNHGRLRGASPLGIALATQRVRPRVERNRASEASAAIAERAVMDVLGEDADQVTVHLGSAKTSRGKSVRGARAIYEHGTRLDPAAPRSWIQKPRIAVGAWANTPEKADAAGAEEARIYNLQRERNVQRARETLARDPRQQANMEYAGRTPEGLQAATRWSSLARDGDVLRAAVLHEAGHALMDFRGLGRPWRVALAEGGLTKNDRRRVSEYGATSPEELFAEVTALVHLGDADAVPPAILRAYRKVTS